MKRPPEFDAAVKQAIDRIPDDDDGTVDHVVRTVAAIVWDAGVQHGRLLTRADLRRVDELKKRLDAAHETRRSEGR